MGEHLSTSASKAATAIALLMASLVFIDQVIGRLVLEYYLSSEISPVERIRGSSPDTLILGSSTGKYAVHPHHLPGKVFNASSDGQGIFYSSSILAQLKSNKNIKRVVLTVDFDDLERGHASSNMNNLVALTPYASKDDKLSDNLNVIDSWFFLKKMSFLYALRGLPKDILHYYIKGKDVIEGYKPLNGTISGPDIEARKTLVSRQLTERGAQLHPAVIEAIHQILNYSEESDVQLIVTETPLLYEIRGKRQDYEVILEELKKILGNTDSCFLMQNYPEEISRISNTSDYYYDGPHLNSKGAVVYTKALSRWINDMCTL